MYTSIWVAIHTAAGNGAEGDLGRWGIALKVAQIDPQCNFDSRSYKKIKTFH